MSLYDNITLEEQQELKDLLERENIKKIFDSDFAEKRQINQKMRWIKRRQIIGIFVGLAALGTTMWNNHKLRITNKNANMIIHALVENIKTINSADTVQYIDSGFVK